MSVILYVDRIPFVCLDEKVSGLVLDEGGVLSMQTLSPPWKS